MLYEYKKKNGYKSTIACGYITNTYDDELPIRTRNWCFRWKKIIEWVSAQKTSAYYRYRISLVSVRGFVSIECTICGTIELAVLFPKISSLSVSRLHPQHLTAFLQHSDESSRARARWSQLHTPHLCGFWPLNDNDDDNGYNNVYIIHALLCNIVRRSMLFRLFFFFFPSASFFLSRTRTTILV